jgi:putative transposase
MPRVARIVIPGLPHHVTQRGNNRQDVFFTDDDRRLYLKTLKSESLRFGLSILGYCLMTNHVHLVAMPALEDSLAKAVGRTDYIYAQTVNRWHSRSGHLWQNRFFSCPLEPGCLGAALRYVERNPVRAKMVRRAWQYPWSSAKAHVEREDETGLLDWTTWDRAIAMPGSEWREWLDKKDDAREVGGLRLNTHRGRPLGSDAFISKMENVLGKRLRPLPVGRPHLETPERQTVK